MWGLLPFRSLNDPQERRSEWRPTAFQLPASLTRAPTYPCDDAAWARHLIDWRAPHIGEVEHADRRCHGHLHA